MTELEIVIFSLMEAILFGVAMLIAKIVITGSCRINSIFVEMLVCETIFITTFSYLCCTIYTAFYGIVNILTCVIVIVYAIVSSVFEYIVACIITDNQGIEINAGKNAAVLSIIATVEAISVVLLFALTSGDLL